MASLEAVVSTLEGYRTDSAGFVRHYFKAEPDAWQLEALKAVDAGRNVAIRSGHGVGKTSLLSWLAIHAVACYPYTKVPCTAPTQHQLSDLLWAEIAMWLNKSPLKSLLQWTATKLSPMGFEADWFAVARASNRPENLAGFHAKKLRYIVDEGSGVADNIMEVVDGACTTENAQIIMAGNPTRRSGYFYDAFHKARAEWHTVHISSEYSIRVSPEYPRTMAAKWGRDSDIYRVRVLGDFPLAEASGFIPLDLVEAAVQLWYGPTDDSGVCEIGLDVARFGSDETAFCIRQGGRVLPIEAHRGWDTTTTAGRARQLVNEHGASAIKVDDGGVGGGVTDMLNEGCSAEVIPCNFGATGDEYYDNAATMWHATLRDMMQAGELALPEDEDLIAQLTTRQYKITSKGKTRLESKQDMKLRGLPSPDRSDALALAFAYSGSCGGIATSPVKREALNF
jgi:phage terminase large subunit